MERAGSLPSVLVRVLAPASAYAGHNPSASTPNRAYLRDGLFSRVEIINPCYPMRSFARCPGVALQVREFTGVNGPISWL